MKLVRRIKHSHLVLVHDTMMAALSFPLALYMRVGDDAFGPYLDGLLVQTLIFTAVAAVVFQFSRVSKGIWRYASVSDLMAIVLTATLVVLLALPALFLVTRLESLPRSQPFINWVLLIVMLGGPRLVYRALKDHWLNFLRPSQDADRVPVLLVGTGDAAELFIRQQHRDPHAPYRVVGSIDYGLGRVGREIHGVRVLGTFGDIEAVLGRMPSPPHRIVIADDRPSASELQSLLDLAQRHGITLARLPRLSDLQGSLQDRIEAQPIAVEDLLGRRQRVLDRDAMSTLIAGRRVLITGAGGTIGAELVRQIAAFAPASITLLDSSEYLLYSIDLELSERHPGLARSTCIADVRDRARVSEIFRSEKPELIFHAAALKHVPMVEANPVEGVLTNVIGTRNVADACLQNGARLMVLISTDKAVNPSSIMGTTKRLAECYCQALDVADRNGAGGTHFVTVRFGNVLASTGSVVPLFQRQLAAGGPLTVTHKDATRYFMTGREAVELVLLASALGDRRDDARGKIFVLDMGEPVKIRNLARQMIRLSGKVPDKDIKICYTGLRPGERLNEVLLHEGEERLPQICDGLMLASPRQAELAHLAQRFDELEETARHQRREQMMSLLRELVPEYSQGEAVRAPAVAQAELSP